MASSIPLTYSLSIIFWWFHFIILPCSHYGALREYSHSIPSNRKFYIYDWPETLVNLWPNIKESTADMKVTSSLNYGTGMILNETIGMYDTFQFGLFRLFHQRAMIDYRRTFNPDEATIFFIPYDVAMDGLVTRKGTVRSPGCPRSREVVEILSKSPYFQRYYGHDHFVVFSGNQGLGLIEKPGCRQFLDHTCENCTKLSLETLLKCAESPHWHSIPFPSNIHWSTNMSVIPWSDYLPQRKYAISYTGSLFSYSRRSRTIRSKFKELCQKYSPDCIMNDMSHDSTAAPSDWTLPLYSTFCFMPPGDLPTRKGFFDSILMGCIPVMCKRLSAHEQWNWNLGLEYALAMTYYVPCEEIIQSQNHSRFIEHLIHLHNQNDEVVMKRFVISKYASRLQYRIPEGEYRSTPFTYQSKSDNTLKSPPVDAFDIIIDKLLNEIDDIQDMVRNPRDRGDWRGIEQFPRYPFGRDGGK